MHLKSTLIVCAVYFLTSAWSIGLNGDQLNLLTDIFKNYKKTTNEVTAEQIEKVMTESFGIANPKIIFRYEPKETDSMNLNYLLRELADTDDKISDKICSDEVFKVKILMPFEVDFYLDEFIKRTKPNQHLGYLTLQQLPEVFKFWKTISDALNAKLVELRTDHGDDYVMNAVEFLSIMLEIKPTSRGLTLPLVEKFVSLCKDHKTGSGSIDPLAIEKLFEKLGITIEHELQLLFQSGRPAEELLIDLMIVAAERNQAVEENESLVLSPSEVVYTIKNFKKGDGNHDGLLSPKEYVAFKDEFLGSLIYTKDPTVAISKAENYFKKFDGIKTINVAEFMEITLFIIRFIEEEPILVDSSTTGDSSQETH